jgi:hypothetical protein
MGVEPAYETIGATYGATRDEDPRIARRIRKALGDAESVVNSALGEIRRVARRRAVIFTCDPAFHDFWLFSDYFPSFVTHARTRLPSLHAYEPLGPLKVIAVPIPRACRDGFAAAYWARPAAYLDPVCRANISGFHFIPQAELRAGLRRLQADLDSGTWHRKHALAGRDSLDCGYRLVVAELPGPYGVRRGG